jgi:hypothetical protein
MNKVALQYTAVPWYLWRLGSASSTSWIPKSVGARLLNNVVLYLHITCSPVYFKSPLDYLKYPE